MRTPDYPDSLVPLTPLALQILTALAAQPTYAYDLVDQTGIDSQNLIVSSKGPIQKVLKRLESYCLIERGEALGARHYYQLTDLGVTILDVERQRLQQVSQLIETRLRGRRV
jgi:DNA-binding PadR family transcriptional regulator